MAHPGTQSVLARDGTVLFEGVWDPTALANVLGREDAFWRGRSVLDIGANTGGLSLELARVGAEVTLAEPDPFGNSISLTQGLIEDVAAAEGLAIRVERTPILACHTLPRHDIVLCLGLIYHFRYPQFLIDYLSSLEPQWLFISCQTHPDDGLMLVNRSHPGVLAEGFLPPDVVLSGWHPTRALLERMLRWAGFTDVMSLTDRLDFPNKVSGTTNSAYYRARLETPVDPNLLKFQYYPR